MSCFHLESDEQAATSPGGTGVGSFFSYGASAFSSVVGKTVRYFDFEEKFRHYFSRSVVI